MKKILSSFVWLVFGGEYKELFSAGQILTIICILLAMLVIIISYPHH